MKIIEMDIDKIIPYENNPRINDNAVDKVVESIKQFGFKQPIVVDKENIIIVGHTRLKALKKLNYKKVPVLIADDLPEEKVKAYRLADNKTNEFASWDIELLENELLELKEFKCDFNISDFGFDMNFDEKEFENDSDLYTKKIDTPEYKQQQDKAPDINLLVDDDKTNKLIDKIKKSNIKEDIKQFLILSAYRHLVFDYEQIAEYYCHACKEIQELMEDSALVIIDFKKAISQGYVELSSKVSEQYLNEYEE